MKEILIKQSKVCWSVQFCTRSSLNFAFRINYRFANTQFQTYLLTTFNDVTEWTLGKVYYWYSIIHLSPFLHQSFWPWPIWWPWRSSKSSKGLYLLVEKDSDQNLPILTLFCNYKILFSLLCRKICWFMVTAFMTSSTNRITRQFNPSWWEVSNLVSVTLVPSWTMLRVKSESFYVEWTSQETQEGKWDLVIKRFVHTIQVTFIHSKRNRVYKPVTEVFGFGFVSK